MVQDDPPTEAEIEPQRTEQNTGPQVASEVPPAVSQDPAPRNKALTAAAAEGVYSGDYRTVFPKTYSKAFNLDSQGRLTINKSMVEVSMEYRPPDGTGPQVSFKLTVDQDFWDFVEFSGLQLKNADGVTLATVSATKSTLTLTPTDAASRLEDVSGTFTFFVDPRITTETRTGVLDLFSPSGSKLGPGDTYQFARSLPNATGGFLVPRVVSETELALFAQPQFVDKLDPFDPRSFSAIIKPLTEGALPICDSSVSVGRGWWIDTDRRLAKDTIPVTTKCSGTSMTITIPSSQVAPAGTTGVRVEGPFVVDRPLSDYTFEYTMKYGSESVTVERTAESGVLDGVAAGHLRPARTDLSMKSVLPKSGRITAGDQFDYQLTTRSAETLRTAYALVTKQLLPKGVDFISATSGGTFDAATRTVTWPARDLKAGADDAYTVTVKATTAASGTLKSDATNSGENTCYKGDTTGSVCAANVENVIAKLDISLKKALVEIKDSNKNGVLGDAGDTVSYSLNVTNKGNTPEASILVTDALLGISKQECLAKPLAAGESVACVGSFAHKISAEEATSGRVLNTATAWIPGGPEATDELEVPAVDPRFSLEKEIVEVADANENGLVGDAGDRIHYRFQVKNTGTSVLEKVLITDPLLEVADTECLKAPLKSGATATCVDSDAYWYTITEEDAKNGHVNNAATATSPGAPNQTDKATTPVYAPAFDFTKEILEIEDTNGNGITADAGDRIHYTFTATNTGNSRLETLLITDPLLDIENSECLAEPLEPTTEGETPRLTKCVDRDAYWYTVTEEDATNGHVNNTATATSPGAPDQTDTTKTPVDKTPVETLPGDDAPARLARTGLAASLPLFLAAAISVTTLGGILLYLTRRKKM